MKVKRTQILETSFPGESEWFGGRCLPILQEGCGFLTREGWAPRRSEAASDLVTGCVEVIL